MIPYIYATILIVFAGSLQQLPAQKIIHTAHFTQKLNDFDMTFRWPKERYFHALPKEEAPYQQFDLFLHEDDNKTAFGYIFVNSEDIPGSMPHIYASNAVNHLASNEVDEWINQQGYTENESKRKFGAMWANQSKFTPKDVFTEKRWCRQIAMYHVDRGLVLVYIFYDEMDDIPIDFGNMPKFNP